MTGAPIAPSLGSEVGALAAVQQLMVAALLQYRPLRRLVSDIYDGPPPLARLPYIALTTGAAIDWGHKTGIGRELSLGLTIYDDGRSAARLHRLLALTETALADGLADPPGWQLVSFTYRRSRILRSALSPWSGLIEYRARLLKI